MYKEKDIELIRKAQGGDISSFESLIINYEKDIYNIAYRMLGNSHDAEDVAQEVCIKIYKNIKRYNEKSKFYTWIYRITMNTCIDDIRKRNRQSDSQTVRLSDEEGKEIEIGDMNAKTPEERYIEKEEKNGIQAKINMLDPDQRAVVVLKYINGLEYEEIAQSLDINLGTVKSRLSRAKKKLLEIFNKSEEHIQTKVRLNNQKGGDTYESKA